MPSPPRSSAMSAAGTGTSVDITMMAVPEPTAPSGLRLVRPPIEGPGPVPAATPAPKKAAAKKASAKKASPPKQAASGPKGEAPPPARKWVEPVSPDMCPDSHPIKAKLSSKLFHLPGMFAYPRTKPDRCYDTEQSAVEDGLTKAKR